MRRFADLPPLGKGIIVAVALGTVAIAAAAFALSYFALYAWVHESRLYADTGVWATRLERGWPLMLDAAFIVAELAAILGGILRGRAGGWPLLVMILTGSLTVVFNVLHATTPAARVAAALPPVLMMVCFQIVIAIVGWVRDLEPTTVVRRVDPGDRELDLAGEMPMSDRSRIVQNGQWGSGVGGGERGATTRAIEAVLATTSPEDWKVYGPDAVVGRVQDEHNLLTTPGYVRKVERDHRATIAAMRRAAGNGAGP